MNITLFYFIGCIVIAVIVIYEALLLKKLNGLLKKSKVLTSLSIIEFAWLIVSGWMLYKFELKPLLMVVPALYLAQSLMGWVYGFYLLSKEGTLDKLEEDTNAEIRIPLKYTDFTLSFGMIFLILSIAASLYVYRPEIFGL